MDRCSRKSRKFADATSGERAMQNVASGIPLRAVAGAVIDPALTADEKNQRGFASGDRGYA
jgi:hypothetical protein